MFPKTTIIGQVCEMIHNLQKEVYQQFMQNTSQKLCIKVLKTKNYQDKVFCLLKLKISKKIVTRKKQKRPFLCRFNNL